MPWAFRNRRAEDLVSLCYKFSAKLLVISRTTQSISGTSLIWRHNNKSSWRNNASLGWGMTTFVYVWLSSVICGTVVPRRWTHSATTPPYSNHQNENIGQGQRSSHATHLLMLLIICTKYGENLSRTVDATERTRFSRPKPKDLEDIGQGQRSLYATHPLILVIICAIYGKNPSRTVDFFSSWRPKNLKNSPKIQISRYRKNVTRDTPSNNSDHLC